MTADEIRAAVQASPQLQRLAAAGNIVALTEMLRVIGQRTRPGDVVTDRDAAARFPALDGQPGPLAFEVAMAALDKYVADNAASTALARRLRARAISRVLERFTSSGLDFGDPAMRSVLDMLALDVLTVAQTNAFKALAGLQPGQVTERQVREAVGLVLPSIQAS